MSDVPMDVSKQGLSHIRWVKGGMADVLAIAADAMTLLSSIPSPPGSRIDGRIGATGGGTTSPVRFKIHSCKRQLDGAFVLEGRPLDMPRGVRDQLSALLAFAVAMKNATRPPPG